MKRLIQSLVFFLTAMAIFGFAKPVNAFDALNKDVKLTLLEIESKVNQRDMSPLGFHVFLTLETIKIIENYYGIDIPKEIEDQILIGCSIDTPYFLYLAIFDKFLSK